MASSRRLSSGAHSRDPLAPPMTTTNLPDELFYETAVQPSLQKYFASRFGGNSFIDSPSRSD
jgi:hypothetical protein